MRYSFHGKVRATGQLVDGYVEAETSTEAIDRLADQGIIGVYSVRAEPKQPRNAVLVAGTPEFDRALYESDQPTKKRRSLPAPAAVPNQYLPERVPLPPPVQPPPAPEPVAAAPAAGGGVTDSTMLQLVDKLSTLIGQMQKFLDRPAQVVYASGGPARSGGGGGGKRAGRAVNEAQNSTLKDIFQNNLDLRRSLAKLAETVAPEAAPANGTAVAEASPGGGADEEPPPPPSGGAPVEGEPMIEAEVVASAEAPFETSGDEASTDLSMHVHDAEHAREAQPAA